MGMRWVVGRRDKERMESGEKGMRGRMRGEVGRLGRRVAASSVLLPRPLLHPGT